MAKHDKASSAPPLTEAQKAVVATKLRDYQQAATYSVERTEISNSLTQELKSKFEDLAEVEDSVLAAKVREWLRNHSKAIGNQSLKEEVQIGKKLSMWRLWAKEHPDEVKVRQAKLMAESNEENKDQVVFWGRAGTELWSELTKEQQEEYEGQLHVSVTATSATVATVATLATSVASAASATETVATVTIATFSAATLATSATVATGATRTASTASTTETVATVTIDFPASAVPTYVGTYCVTKDNQAYVELHDFNDAFDSAPSFKNRAEWENDLWGQWKAYSHEVILDKKTSQGSDEEDDSGDSDDDRKFSMPVDDEGLPILPPYNPRKRLRPARMRQIIRLFLNRHYREWVLLIKF
ncbi:hypothetical protein WOLCODRAFT_159512 [Wolfiporia cocos MD-104 SS10]|uniref:Uncharacterized protein n=1 Tax=Wolfiporia cocos (strain MD-104) TaxID=742152 RepID=A0A2H3JB04_WOLCO|nr:hypothetical protein WOLCODRAFT_159512 [Wolfiporia cocos MD-104 SS10]